MEHDHDRMMIVRTQLSDLLDALNLTSFDTNPLQFLIRLESIRQTAHIHGFNAVAEIAAVFEAAMHRPSGTERSSAIVDNFTAILNDSIGCRQLDPAVAQSLLATVALRLH